MGADYQGTANITIRGLACQMYSVQEPNNHLIDLYGDHNYCRNDYGMEHGVFCITTDTNTVWDYCPVPLCETGRIVRG